MTEKRANHLVQKTAKELAKTLSQEFDQNVNYTQSLRILHSLQVEFTKSTAKQQESTKNSDSSYDVQINDTWTNIKLNILKPTLSNSYEKSYFINEYSHDTKFVWDLKKDKNLLICGEPGTGKTFIVEKCIEYASHFPHDVEITYISENSTPILPFKNWTNGSFVNEQNFDKEMLPELNEEIFYDIYEKTDTYKNKTKNYLVIFDVSSITEAMKRFITFNANKRNVSIVLTTRNMKQVHEIMSLDSFSLRMQIDKNNNQRITHIYAENMKHIASVDFA